MGTCDVCGNDYEATFTLVTAHDATYTFDSFECAIQQVAPRCAHCGVTVIGHGVLAHEQVYCCAHCADVHGVRNVSDNAGHAVNAGVPDGAPIPDATSGSMSPGPPPGGPPPLA